MFTPFTTISINYQSTSGWAGGYHAVLVALLHFLPLLPLLPLLLLLLLLLLLVHIGVSIVVPLQATFMHHTYGTLMYLNRSLSG